MNPRPEKSLFEEAAALKGMAVSFVEKDWFVTQVIAALAALEVSGFEIIFSGGTALSKGHGLLQRFSEDVDFRVRAPQAVNRKALSNLGKTQQTGENSHRNHAPLDCFSPCFLSQLWRFASVVL